MFFFEKLKSPIFNLFYIMTEGVAFDGGPAVYRKVIFLLFIDVLQVLRVMCSFRYGWTDATTQILKNTDLVYLFTDLVGKLIPRYSFFILASLLVLFALGDSYYVVRLFTAGNVQTMWPVKLLRFLVGALVTTFFSTVIKWLLIPVECLASKEVSFSSFVHNEEGRCTPWDMPELVVTVPTILLSAAYIAFALGTSFLAFEINPLNRHPRAQYTGRVEMLFTSNKVAVTLLVYFSELITPVAVAIIFFLWTYTVFHKHLTVLPFHSTITNNVRGGIYGMVLWMSFATIVVASLKTSLGDAWDTEEHPTWLQPLQYCLVAGILLAFLAGFIVTSFVQYKCGRSIGRLRGDFERQLPDSLATGSTNGLLSPRRKSFGDAGSLAPSMVSHAAKVGLKRGTFDKFFDIDSESKRRFPHEWRAGVILRHLLYKRNLQDLAFMQFLVEKAVEEHPESNLLQVLVLVFRSFVFRDPTEASAIQKALKLQHKILPLDFQYVVFAAERKSNQAMRSADIGQAGAVSGISLMEFEVSFEKARKSHSSCVSKIRDFWRHVKRRRHAGLDQQQAEDLIKLLDEYEEEKGRAKKEYEALIEKYPQSVQLLLSYGLFCDTILNDVKQSEALKHNAACLEGEVEEVLEEEQDKGTALGGGGKEWGEKSSSSENEPYRNKIQRFLRSHRDAMMGAEAKQVRTLHRRVQVALLMLMVLATAGFALTDFYLFNDVALRNIGLIDKTGLFRAYAISSNFLLRSAWIGAQTNNSKLYATATGNIGGAMANLREQHFRNYRNFPSSGIKDFYLNSELGLDVPIKNSWFKRTFNYWDMANDFARRVNRGAEVSMAELLDSEYGIDEMSEEKANIAYAFENTQTKVIPTFETMVKMYEKEVFRFGRLATTLVIANVCLNSLLVLAISFFVLRALVRVIQNMESKYVFCDLALRLPRATAATIYKYYDEVEINMKIVEDEEAQRTAIMASGDGDKSDQTHARRPSLIDAMPKMYATLTVDAEDVDMPSGNGYMSNGNGNMSPPNALGSLMDMSTANQRLRGDKRARDAKQPLPTALSPVISGSAASDEQAMGSLTPRLKSAIKRSGSSGIEDGDGASSVDDSGRGLGRFKRRVSISEDGDTTDHDDSTHGALNARFKLQTSSSFRKTSHRSMPGPTANALGDAGRGFMVVHTIAEPRRDSLPTVLPLRNAPRVTPAEPPVSGAGLGLSHGRQRVGLSLPDALAPRSRLSQQNIQRLSGEEEEEDAAAPGAGALVEEQEQLGGKKEAIERWLTDNSNDAQSVTGTRSLQNTPSGGASHAMMTSEGRMQAAFAEAPPQLSDDESETGIMQPSLPPLALIPGYTPALLNEDDGSPTDSQGDCEEAEKGQNGRAEEFEGVTSEVVLLQRGERGRNSEVVLETPERVRNLHAHSCSQDARQGGGSDVREADRVRVSRVREETEEEKEEEKEEEEEEEEEEEREVTRMAETTAAALMKTARGGSKGSPQTPQLPRGAVSECSEESGRGSKSMARRDREPLPDGRRHTESMGSVSRVIKARQQWHSRVEVYVAAAAVVLAICVLSMAYPARNIAAIVNQAPTTNQAGRRRFLVRSCCHFARELVLDDGFSRMDKSWTASALRFHLEELKTADRAVRMGNELDVSLGADFRNKEHNVVMYNEGCPWREDPTDCSTPGMEGRGDVNEHGLQYLLLSFFDAVEKVLARYAPESALTSASVDMQFRTHEDVADSSEYTNVQGSAEKRATLESDPDVKFVLSAFAGDVFDGLGMTLQLFYAETSRILARTHVETRLLFGVYFSVVAVMFYHLLFRRTILVATAEVEKTRSMVLEMPTHVLKSDDVRSIVAFFEPAADEEEEQDGEAMPERID